MQNVNYITHLNNVFEIFHEDQRIKQGHMTLYLAFFQKWNRLFFQKTLTINRELIMERAKIKSKTTYHNYLKDLNDWDYLQYYPSYHPARGSRIKMAIFGTSTGTSSGTSKVQNLANSVPEPSQSLVPYYKLKTKENLKKRSARPFNEFEVLKFFNENKWSAIEGKKFFIYYQAKDWKLDSGQNVKNWQTAASNFVKNGYKIKHETTNPISGYVDNLHKKQNKNYGQPL